MADYDLTPKTNPLQGVTLADMVAAKTPALTPVLQSLGPTLQALQQRRQQAMQLASLQAMNQPGFSQGQASLDPQQVLSLLPVLGDRALSLGESGAQQRGLDLQKQQAQVEDIQAQAEQRRRGGGQSSNLTPEQKDNLEWGLTNKLIAPAQLTYRGPKAEILSSMLSHMREGGIPRQSLMSLDAMLSGQKAEASGIGSVRGRQGQEIGAMAGSMEDMLDSLKPLVPKISPAQVKLVNSAYQRFLKETNDPVATEALSYLNSATYFYAALLKNGGTPNDQEVKDAHNTLLPTLNAEGFEGVDKALRAEARSRVTRIRGAGYDEPNPNTVPTKTRDTITVMTSDGQRHEIFRKNLPVAKKRDPLLRIIQ